MGGTNTCQSDQFCSYDPAAICGRADATGTCQPRPTGCTGGADVQVCGCDGVTYDSECLANMAGTSVDTQGPCPSTGKSCGGKVPPGTNNTCSADEFCDYTRDAMCGAADAPGTCQPRPQACPQVAGAEVCGCDNQTYPSECDANVAGVGVLHDGAC
jgi:hypothetical protein